MAEVDSGDVLAMRDESFAELIDEINAKRAQTSMAAALGWSLAGVSFLVVMIAGAAWAPLLLLGLIGWAVGKWLDSYRRTSVLFYDLEPDVQQAYERAIAGFGHLAGCAGKWHVEAGGAVRDFTAWKRNAGATHIVRKQPTTLAYKLPRAVTCNLTPPAMHVGKQVIHFFPDVALVDDGRCVGAVGYSALTIAWQDSNFIEEGPAPGDAQVIGQTWKHPNKNGGPNRRFKDNRQIPICRYEVMHLRSGSGLNELVEFSRAAGFATALVALPRNDALNKPSLPSRSQHSRSKPKRSASIWMDAPACPVPALNRASGSRTGGILMRKIIAAALISAALAACSQHDDKSDRRDRKEHRGDRGDRADRGDRGDRGGRGGRGGRLERLDTDHDGLVEKSEAPERMQRRFDRLDTNHDGKLSQDELESGRRR